MKKKLLVLALCFAMISTFVGCGKSNNDSNSANSSKDGVVNLVVWGGVPGESGPQDVVDAWNKANPNIQVTYNRFVNDDTGNTKLDTAIMSGEQIDLFFTYTTDLIKKRIEGGMVEPLEQFGVEEFIKNDITSDLSQVAKIDGKYYSLPTVRELFGFLVNEDMLVEQGVEIPKNWTVDQFVEVSKQLTHEKDGKQIYGVHPYIGGLPVNLALTVLGGDSYYKNNGTESNFDSEAFAANIRVNELMQNGYAMPFEEIFSRKLETYSHSAFLNGEIAMVPFSTWMLRYVKDLENYPHDFKTTFAAFPTIKEGVANNYQAYLNNNICMNSNSKYKKEAWEFMKYWIGEGSVHMLKAGKVPAWNKIDTEMVAERILGENADKLFNAEAYKEVVMNPDVEFIVDTITTAYPQIVRIYKEETQAIFLNQIDEAQYLKNLKKRADKAIKDEQ